MLGATQVFVGIAIAIASAAAVSDFRSARIPNWLTLPPLALGPLCYGLISGLGSALASILALVLAGAAPYVAFRLGAMGGGDVKLFAALGAMTGFDPRLGLEIELLAFALATGLVLSRLAGRRARRGRDVPTTVRLGPHVFIAATSLLAPHLNAAWGLF